MLMETTTDPTRLKELDALRKKISNEAGRLIDAQLDVSTAEYKEATAGLNQASAAIRDAIRGLEAVKKAIEVAPQALIWSPSWRPERSLSKGRSG